MKSNETIVGDPHEFIANRTELALDQLGLHIRQADWGDSEHDLFLVRQKLGEIPADRHPPNRDVKIKLSVLEEGAVTLAEAAAMLQKKIGLWQTEGGFVKRVPDSHAQALSPVVYQVHGAAIGGLHGWYMAHRQHAPDVEIRLTTGPYCYGLTAVETEVYSEEVNRQLVFEVPNIRGTAPGLLHWLVENTGTDNWLSCIAALESRDYSEGSTAELWYQCEKLTLLGGTAKAARTGASGEVAKNEKLSEEWLAILGSEIVGVGNMTHLGARRFYIRGYDSNSEAGNVQLKLEWRALGSPFWSENEIIETPIRNGMFIADLGECRPQEAVIGPQVWEWRIAARTKAGKGSNLKIELDEVWIFPTEQFCRVNITPSVTTPTALAARDGFNGAGAATGKAPEVGPETFKAAEGSDTTDFEESGGKLVRTAVSDSGTLGGTLAEKGRAIGLNVNLNDTIFQYDYEHTLADEANITWGAFVKYTDKNNWLELVHLYFAPGEPYNGWQLQLYIKKGGVGEKIGQSAFPTGSTLPHVSYANPKGRVMIQVEGDRCIVWHTADPDVYPFEKVMTVVDARIGELVAGDCYIFDNALSATAQTRRYDNFICWEPDGMAACYAGAGMEFRSDGVYREEPASEAWGILIPDAGSFLPYAPPSGLENRPLRGIIVPSEGDLVDIPDSGSPKMKTKITYYPGYHFMAEAA